jgi:hypothetical protein
MTGITAQQRTAFREQGYVVVPGVLRAAQIAAARAVVDSMIIGEPPPGPHFVWPRFGAEGHPLLDLYRDSGLAALAAQLLRPPVLEPEFAQVAATIPPYPHRPGGPHVDGLTGPEPDGRPGTFSLLAGLWLTDQSEPHHGNLWVWPGTHLRFGRYLAERGADALTRVDEMNPGPYPKIDLGTPVQATGPAGSVLFAHYLLAHNIGGNDEGDRRETIYYRLQAEGHRDRWREFVTDPLIELREV